MKQIALGRKNWIFIGSVAAGERAADFFSLASSAVRNDLDVWAYAKDVLDLLLAGSTDYQSLRPDVWKQSHPEAIRSTAWPNVVTALTAPNSVELNDGFVGEQKSWPDTGTDRG